MILWGDGEDDLPAGMLLDPDLTPTNSRLSMNNTLVVIPTYNEIENIHGIIQAVLDLDMDGVNLLVADDNSPDGTGEMADRMSAAHPGKVHVLHRKEKAGLGKAYLDGFAWGLKHGFEILCEMDADFSHDPKDLPCLVGAVRNGADLAIGSRRVKGGRVIGWGPHRHLMSWSANALSRLALRLKTKDVTAGFRAYGKRSVKLLLEADIQSDGYAFQEETLFLIERSGHEVKEIPVTFRDRAAGVSKLTPREALGFFQTLWRLKTEENDRN